MGTQWRSPSWARVGHRKHKKLTTLDLLYEILNNFATIFVFGRSKFALIVLVTHLEN